MGVGQVFVFIIAALTFAMIMIFGYKMISQFLQRGEQVQFYQFKTDLETSIKRIYSEFGAVRVTRFQLPPQYTKICFVDLDTDPASLEEDALQRLCVQDPIACAVWQNAWGAPAGSGGGGYDAADENVFLTPIAPVKIKVYHLSILPDGYLCLPIERGQFSLLLEGQGDSTRLSVPQNN